MQTNSILDTVGRAVGLSAAALRKAWGNVIAAAREAGQHVRRLTEDTQSPLDPLDANTAPLPGTSTRAFWVGLVVVSLSVVWALATFLILTNLTPIAPREQVVYVVLFVNLLLVIAMVAVIAMHIAGLTRAWRKKVAGARLHARIVALFSVIAALPAILLAVAAATTFSRALDNWFNQQTMSIVLNSLNVAHAYLDEHGQVIRTDIVNMAKDLDEAASQVASDENKFRQLLFAQAGLRDLPVAYVVNARGQVKVAVLEDEKIPYIAPPEHLLRAADGGQVPLLMPRDTFRVAAVAKLNNFPDSYLYVARGVDPQVVRHLRSTEDGVKRYESLRQVRGGLKFAHGLMYFMISLTALLAAIWAGLWFAGRFVAPIRRLITAAQQVTRGNLKVELPILRGESDLRRLSVNFNAMTKELERQRTDLVTANTQLIERRRFMEAVLSGVSAGVIGLDRDERITLASRSAQKLLGLEEAELIGKPLADSVPQFGAILHEAVEQRNRPQRQVTIIIGGEERNFAVRVTREEQGEEDYGSVITFDDVTELVAAQRTSAWADVARRIAHEIKNPLTPIQLSAERLRRKYSNVIKDDRETFDRCTDTIIRQVGDVVEMVNAFSQFARTPQLQMEENDIREVVRKAVFDRQEAASEIVYDTRLGGEPIMVSCDRRVISQAIGNLLKNAQEAIQSWAESANKEAGWRARIETVVRRNGDLVDIEIMDNGPGLPKHNRNRLLEPYVTTKGAKGTGLGLAIVQKSVEQHGGALSLEDAPTTPDRQHGALLRITLPVLKPKEQRAARAEPAAAAAASGA